MSDQEHEIRVVISDHIEEHGGNVPFSGGRGYLQDISEDGDLFVPPEYRPIMERPLLTLLDGMAGEPPLPSKPIDLDHEKDEEEIVMFSEKSIFLMSLRASIDHRITSWQHQQYERLAQWHFNRDFYDGPTYSNAISCLDPLDYHQGAGALLTPDHHEEDGYATVMKRFMETYLGVDYWPDFSHPSLGILQTEGLSKLTGLPEDKVEEALLKEMEGHSRCGMLSDRFLIKLHQPMATLGAGNKWPFAVAELNDSGEHIINALMYAYRQGIKQAVTPQDQ